MHCYRLIFVIVFIFKVTSSTDLAHCPTSDVKFEKILGLRPKVGIGSPTVLFQSSRNWIPVTEDCISRCNSDENCASFVLYYNASICYSYEGDLANISENAQVFDTNAAWFVKTCLKGNCDEKLWAFERIPGAALIGNDTKTLPSLVSRNDCQQYCLNETEFQCKSAKYKIREAVYGAPDNQTRGTCILSDANRHLLPYAYRVSTFDEEYFENECESDDNKSVSDPQAFCAYEEYENVTLTHYDELYENGTKSACQEMCDNKTNYNCRGFTLLRMPNQNSVCLFNSEDTKIYGPKLLRANNQAIYYERATCLNITVSCTETYMTIVYNPDMNFSGRLYMQGYSDMKQCYANGMGNDDQVVLKLPLLTFQCGISKANDSSNRSLLSGTMILQYNSLIQTHNDRVIRVGCIFGNDSKILIGTGVKVTDSPIGTGTITSSSLNQTGIPTVEMRVVDANTQNEVSDTEIGQELQLIIDVKPPHGPYDIWASHLVAMTENNEESIFLLDDHGCPTNLNVFPALQKIVTNTTRQLRANFQSFKFASSSVLRFSVLVQFCPKQCPPINCGQNVISYGRKKRNVQSELSSHLINTINGTSVVKINRTEFNSQRPSVREVPLEFIMLVRDNQYASDKLIYGEGSTNKILVAGYDYINNQICMDYSLVIGLLVVWVIVQIIFVIACVFLVRRYKRYYDYHNSRQSMEELHKNFNIGFSNLDNRRVHWADDSAHFT